MARIRSVKPEFFTSETIASFSHAARLTFIGLWTHADDGGRAPDNPRLLKAAVWPLDDDVTVADVANHLAEFEAAGRICRYTVDGKRYLHIVSWGEHQKPKNPSTRHPECPRQTHGRPELPPADPTPVDALPQPYPSPTPALPPEGDRGSASRARLRDLGAGSREQGAGIPPSAGREFATADTPSTATPNPDTPQALIAAYLDACKVRPPKRVVDHTAREVKRLLTEGVPPAAVRDGLELLRLRAKHPSVLPALVNEVLNPPEPQRPPPRDNRPAHVTPPGAPRCEHGQHAKLCDVCHPKPVVAPPPNLREALRSSSPAPPLEAGAPP